MERAPVPCLRIRIAAPQRRHSLPCRLYTHSRAPGSSARVVRRSPVYVTIPLSAPSFAFASRKRCARSRMHSTSRRCQRAHQPERMHAARKQHLTLVDIPESRHDALVQQHIRDLFIAMRQQPGLRFILGELCAQQIRPELRNRRMPGQRISRYRTSPPAR